MPKHRFAVGQTVQLKTMFGGLTTKVAQRYRITGVLPPKDNSPQYRIRSDEERHERVTTEDDLEEAEPASPEDAERQANEFSRR